jgi:hypothetical protein
MQPSSSLFHAVARLASVEKLTLLPDPVECWLSPRTRSAMATAHEAVVARDVYAGSELEVEVERARERFVLCGDRLRAQAMLAASLVCAARELSVVSSSAWQPPSGGAWYPVGDGARVKGTELENRLAVVEGVPGLADAVAVLDGVVAEVRDVGVPVAGVDEAFGVLSTMAVSPMSLLLSAYSAERFGWLWPSARSGGVLAVCAPEVIGAVAGGGTVCVAGVPVLSGSQLSTVAALVDGRDLAGVSVADVGEMVATAVALFP